jgi:putative YphP/YqiW family bacilliredoxin
MYPAELVAPMSRQLTDNGFEALETAEAVDEVLADSTGTVLVVVNSVCGCAAGSARPGVLASLENQSKKPGRLTTVFAGVDKEAVAKAREYMIPYPPSSPSVALFKDGQLVHFLERHHIEGANAQLISQNLKAAYEHYC